MSFLTCFWLFPQKEHFSRSPPSPNLATTPPRIRWNSAHARRHRQRSELTTRDHFVDDPVFLRFERAHDEVAVGVLRDLLDRLAGVVREQLVEGLAHAHDLLRLDLDVDGLTRRATVRLVDEHPRVREDEALAVRAGGEQHRGSRRGLADADRKS